MNWKNLWKNKSRLLSLLLALMLLLLTGCSHAQPPEPGDVILYQGNQIALYQSAL